MRTRMIKLIGLGVVLMAWALLLVHTTVQAKLQTPDADQLIQNAPAQPQPPPAESVIPPAVPAADAVIVNLCATTGTLALPGGGSVDIWGFVLGNTCAEGDATLPGPVIRVNAGDVVTINLTNNLDDPTSILIAGQDVSSSAGSSGTFTTEATAGGGTASYSFTAQAGTYLYESGTDPSRQIPMGLYGALIVDTVPLSGSSSGQAYDGSGTGFEAEAVLLLSEIDPNLNANPSGFNLLNYHPTHWLINGKGYPNTDPIAANPGERVLLRYLNAGFDYPSMTLLGAYQRVIAKEAFELANAFDVVAEIIPAGATADMIVDTTGLDGALPLYNRNMYVTNGNAYPGGMLTFMTFGAPPPGANLAITKSDAIDPVTVGDVVTYTVTVSNSGPDPAANVVMTDTLPAGVTYGSATPDQGSCSELSSIVTCNLGNIANGGSVNTVVVVTTTADGTIINTANVTSDTSDPNPADNSIFEDTTVNPVPVSGANLTISKTDDADPVTVGDNVIYTVTISNSGPDLAANVVMTDTLPVEVNFVSASAGCTESAGVVTCALGNIGSGADAVVTIEVATTVDGVITNNAIVTSDTSDPNPTNNSTSEDTTVNSVYGVSIAPATDSQTDTPGTLVSYTLDVTNDGNGPDTFDVNVTGNTWSTSAPATVGPLAAGATAQITVDVTIPAGANDGDSDVATITVTSQADNTKSASSNLTTHAVNTIHVGDLDNTSTPAGGPNWNAQVVVTVHKWHVDGAVNPDLVNGATVTVNAIRIRKSNGSQAVSALTCTTNASGQCSVSQSVNSNQFENDVTFNVTNVASPTPYDSGFNHDPDGDSDGITIVVANPG